MIDWLIILAIKHILQSFKKILFIFTQHLTFNHDNNIFLPLLSSYLYIIQWNIHKQISKKNLPHYSAFISPGK